MSSVVIPHFMVRFPKASGIRLETSTSTTTTEKQKQRTKSIIARIAASLVSSTKHNHPSTTTQQCSSHHCNNRKQLLTDPVHALPYDIVCLILDQLALRDLLCCLNVSSLWSDCIIQWPHLWNRLVEELPTFDRTFANAVLRDTTTTTFRLTGPAKSDMTEGLLQLLRYVGTRCERLTFDHLNLSYQPQLMSHIFARNTKLQTLTLLDCSMDVRQLHDLFETAGPHLKQLMLREMQWTTIPSCSFDHHDNNNNDLHHQRSALSDQHYPFLKRERLWRRSLMRSNSKTGACYYALTRLRLSFIAHGSPTVGYRRSADDGGYCDSTLQQLLGKALMRCVHLEYLQLDVRDPCNHALLVQQAIKTSRRLTHCIVSPDCDIPRDTVLACWHNDSTTTTTTTTRPGQQQGLKVLVMTAGKSGRIGCQSGKSILAKTHRTLELMYLHYDDLVVTAAALVATPSHCFKDGFPFLRELRLSTEERLWGSNTHAYNNSSSSGHSSMIQYGSSDIMSSSTSPTLNPNGCGGGNSNNSNNNNSNSSSSSNRRLTIEKALALMLAQCPALQVFILEYTLGWQSGGLEEGISDPLRIDQEGLLAMAKGCPQLRHVELMGQYFLPVWGLLQFSKVGGNQLERIKLSFADRMTDQDFVEMTVNMPRLRWIDYRTESRRPIDVPQANALLHQRGGAVRLV